jgi:hypothetical protein
MFDKNLIVGLIVIAVIVLIISHFMPQIKKLLAGAGIETFANKKPAGAKKGGLKATNGVPAGTHSDSTTGAVDQTNPNVAKVPKAPAALSKAEGFADYLGGDVTDSMGAVPMGSAQKPQGCYPREQLNPSELLPKDVNSAWAEANPTGMGDVQNLNFISAGALVGINTIGQSLRNANYQIRSEPPNPQVTVGPWSQSTMESDLMRRPLE